MQPFKRILSGFLCMSLLTGALAACGTGGASSAPSAAETESSPASSQAESSQPAEDTPESAAPTGGKFEFWNDKLTNVNGSILDGLSQAILDDSGIEMEIVSYPDVAAYQTALQQSIKESSAPGIFTWWSGDQLNTLAKNGLLEDLTEEWEKYYIPAGISPDVADSLSYDGKIYAAPYGLVYNTVLYNKDVFAKVGCEVPTTFDEFLAVCDQLTAAGVTPIGLKDDSWASFIWFQQMLAVYDPAIYLGVCDGSIPYTDPKVVEVMEMWRSMFDKGYFAKPVKYSDNWKAFAKGDVAMMLEPTNSLPSIVSEYDMVSGENFDAFVVPSKNGGKGIVFFEVSPMAIPAAGATKETAKEAMRAFMGDKAQKIMWNDIGMGGSGTTEMTDPTLKKMAGFGADSEHYQLILRFYENTPAELRDVAIDELAKFMYSGAPVDQTLSTIQAKADETFAK